MVSTVSVSTDQSEFSHMVHGAIFRIFSSLKIAHR